MNDHNTSYIVFLGGKPLHLSLMFVMSNSEGYLESTFQVLHSMVGLWIHIQILGKAGKAC